MASRNIMVVDDEIGIRELLSDILKDEGHRVMTAENAQVARDMRLEKRPDLVLLDIWMPDCDGISLLKEWGNAGLLNMPVVMMSGHGTIDTAVEATRIGAFDFLEKPIAMQKLLKTVGEALTHADSLPKTEMNLASLGKSQVVLELKQRLELVSRAKTPLLLIGKGGSVELCARFLHMQETPWLALTEFDKLTSAPLELLKQAREGVIFIEEFSTLSKTEQKGLSLLLSNAAKYDVRVICSSVHSLPKLTENAQLDQSLLQSLSRTSLKVPGLDEHQEDIPDLVQAMSTLLTEASGITYKSFDTAALNALRNAEWPGDLKQLQAVVQNLMLTSLEEKVTQDDVARVIEQFSDAPADSGAVSLPIDLGQPLRSARDEFERYYFRHHMKLVNNNMSRLAEISGLERTHLYRKLKQLGVSIKG